MNLPRWRDEDESSIIKQNTKQNMLISFQQWKRLRGSLRRVTTLQIESHWRMWKRHMGCCPSMEVAILTLAIGEWWWLDMTNLFFLIRKKTEHKSASHSIGGVTLAPRVEVILAMDFELSVYGLEPWDYIRGFGIASDRIWKQSTESREFVTPVTPTPPSCRIFTKSLLCKLVDWNDVEIVSCAGDFRVKAVRSFWACSPFDSNLYSSDELCFS